MLNSIIFNDSIINNKNLAVSFLQKNPVTNEITIKTYINNSLYKKFLKYYSGLISIQILNSLSEEAKLLAIVKQIPIGIFIINNSEITFFSRYTKYMKHNNNANKLLKSMKYEFDNLKQ